MTRGVAELNTLKLNESKSESNARCTSEMLVALVLMHELTLRTVNPVLKFKETKRARLYRSAPPGERDCEQCPS